MSASLTLFSYTFCIFLKLRANTAHINEIKCKRKLNIKIYKPERSTKFQKTCISCPLASILGQSGSRSLSAINLETGISDRDTSADISRD